MMKFAPRILFLLGTGLSLSSVAQAATPIEIWHSFDGASAVVFADLVQRYNQQQTEVQVQLTHKGTAQQTVEAALAPAAVRPHLLQVRDDLGEQVMQANISRPLRGVYQPAFGDDGWFVPNTPSFPRDVLGRPYAYPIAAEVPVLFYNKDAFAKAGLDPEAPPNTWFALQAVALKLSQAGAECPYTTSHQSWIFLENLSSWHNEPFVLHAKNPAKENPKLKFNALLQVRHVALMNSWVVSELLRIKGEDAESDQSFASGECAVLTSGTGALGEVLANNNFRVGVAPLPYYEEASNKTWHTQIGGASLWLIEGKSKEDYKAVAHFLAWFSSTDIAAEWHQRTGYLPVTEAAHAATRKSAYYQPWPALETQLHNVGIHTKPLAPGIRLTHWARLRALISKHLNLTWNQQKPPKQALDDAVREGDQLLSSATEPVAVLAKRKGGEKTGKKVQ